MDFKRKLLVGEGEVVLLQLGAILDVVVCLYPNVVSQFFNCSPHIIKEWMQCKTGLKNKVGGGEAAELNGNNIPLLVIARNHRYYHKIIFHLPVLLFSLVSASFLKSPSCFSFCSLQFTARIRSSKFSSRFPILIFFSTPNPSALCRCA